MSEQVRETYAQKKLLDLLQERKLKSWCEETMCHTQHYISLQLET